MNKQSGEKHNRKRILLILLCLVLIAGIVLLAVNFDAIRRHFSFKGDASGSRTDVFYYSANRSNAYAAVSDGLALASPSGVQYLNAQGEKVISKTLPMQNPAVSTNGSLSAAFDIGGYKLQIFNTEQLLLGEELDEMIVDVSVGDGGYIAVSTQETGYKGSVTVYDQELEPAFKWFSGSGSVLCAAVSPNNQNLAVCSVDEQGGKIVFLDAASDQQKGSFQSPGALILELRYLDEHLLAAVGENAFYLLDNSGNLLSSYDYQGFYLQNFCLDADGYVTLYLSEGRAGTGGVLVTLDYSGAVEGLLDAADVVLNVSGAGKYTAVLYEDELVIYNVNLSVYARTDGVSGASQALVREDGTVILISGYSASLYIP